MGMQIVRASFAIGHFVSEHWVVSAVTIAVIAICTASESYWIHKKRPKDAIGNGIVIGQAKAFDNRSLALRVERLNAGLETLKVVNQNLTDNLSTFQEQTSSEEARSLSFRMKRSSTKTDREADSKKTGKEEEKAGGPSADGTKIEYKPAVGLAASDILNDQLNLASQIFNLQLLYERSLSDRMIDDQSRLQTVLGFQVSITPPAGYEDCVAVVEVAVRTKATTAVATSVGPAQASSPAMAVSLVALMPQEKTYNAESVSSSERSIEGSAVARVLTMGLSSKSGTRQLFIHRDSDTVAFERNPLAKPCLLANATVFGWEFRPVLGRRTVSSGTRQMLAVVAIPIADKERAGDTILEVKTQSYWRLYNRKTQTSGPNWSWHPWHVDRSTKVEFGAQELKIPNTAMIQSSLAPRITDIRWVNSGQGKATVIVTGSNFFSGTKVVIGGFVHREEDATLTLKSDQALEFETTIDSLATGDAVLSGRFGPSFQLKVPDSKLTVDSLFISRATIRPLRRSKAFRVSIDITGQDANGSAKDLTVADLGKLPESILFVGTEPVAMPYDYEDVLQSADPNAPNASQGQPPAVLAPGAWKFVRVQAWISAKTLAKSPSVSFRVPFCGFDYQTSQPLSFSEPTAIRMGGNLQTSVFRIFYPQGFGGTSTSLSIDLDRTYSEADPALARMSETEYRFTVPNDIVSKYQSMVVRIGSAEPYLLSIPPEDKPLPKAVLDINVRPPQIPKGQHGPVEWVGTALDAITEVAILQNPPQGSTQSVTVIAQHFITYANGTKILVYLTPGATDSEGKLLLECTTSSGDKVTLPLFVTER
jgi:hypothetical protein